MISRLVVVPHPPLLVPELVSGAVTDTEPVRSACLAAARDLASHSPDWVAVAVDPSGPRLVEGVTGTFRGFGVDVRVSLTDHASPAAPASPAADDLPLPVLIAAWLREQAGARSVRVHLVPPDLPTSACAALGGRLAGSPALLVLGDGSHRHGDQAVGRPDDRAEPFDSDVHKALATADTAALSALDPALAAELGAQGRAAWQVAAAVPGAWRCTRSTFLAPFGVGYHVAVWDA
ncbi:class III extradiol dioxygenase subunit B-like domain-containing protein [Saccharothrix sp. S26]|uniref:class III extradiol dioxygenase subunit B-like domain-containing protein n=1 Tax=Saccharothrix sp. S26 TaxID=2907215 RepID=UPI001F428349|nr:class III extradiol dioxygenase subunit B-like domain-containing protein [Saccharothrix sp. S26]MCE6997631.1 class III extradiol dioxygenase subunit B-like domain-containing protein [Saccharothrix sp. S26]